MTRVQRSPAAPHAGAWRLALSQLACGCGASCWVCGRPSRLAWLRLWFSRGLQLGLNLQACFSPVAPAPAAPVVWSGVALPRCAGGLPIRLSVFCLGVASACEMLSRVFPLALARRSDRPLSGDARGGARRCLGTGLTGGPPLCGPGCLSPPGSPPSRTGRKCGRRCDRSGAWGLEGWGDCDNCPSSSLATPLGVRRACTLPLAIAGVEPTGLSGCRLPYGFLRPACQLAIRRFLPCQLAAGRLARELAASSLSSAEGWCLWHAGGARIAEAAPLLEGTLDTVPSLRARVWCCLVCVPPRCRLCSRFPGLCRCSRLPGSPGDATSRTL